jgi:hypothetical protein
MTGMTPVNTKVPVFAGLRRDASLHISASEIVSPLRYPTKMTKVRTAAATSSASTSLAIDPCSVNS